MHHPLQVAVKILIDKASIHDNADSSAMMLSQPLQAGPRPALLAPPVHRHLALLCASLCVVSVHMPHAATHSAARRKLRQGWLQGLEAGGVQPHSGGATARNWSPTVPHPALNLLACRSN